MFKLFKQINLISISSHHTPLFMHKNQLLPWSVFSHEKYFLILEFSLLSSASLRWHSWFVFHSQFFTFHLLFPFSRDATRQEIQTWIWTWNAATGEAEIRSKSEPFINQTWKVFCCNLCLILLCMCYLKEERHQTVRLEKGSECWHLNLVPRESPDLSSFSSPSRWDLRQHGGPCPDLMSCFPRAAEQHLPPLVCVTSRTLTWPMGMSLLRAHTACVETCYTKGTKFAKLLSCHPTCLSGSTSKLWDKIVPLESIKGDTLHCHGSSRHQPTQQLMPLSRTCTLVVFALCKIQIACGISSEASQKNNYYFSGKLLLNPETAVPQSLVLKTGNKK